MPHYEIIFEDGAGADASVPQVGEVINVAGEAWEIKGVEARGAECPRLRLGRPAAQPHDVEAHDGASVTALVQATSFESELVYTLSDLSSRRNSLSQVLTAYWGQGAA